MALIDFDLLRLPLSAEAPCGPDLDHAGDADYMNLMARIEGLLPESYYSFDRAAVDLAAETEALSRLAARSRDLRVMTVLAKLLVFDRKLAAFSSCMAAIGWLLDQHWSDVHPGGDEMGLRGAVLQTLDDVPHVVFPLQYLPILESRRTGAISFRSVMIASGEVKKRGEESAPDASTIEQAIADCDLAALIATRDDLARLKTAVALIRSAWIAHAGFDEAPNLDKLAALADRILAFVDGGIGKRDPSLALNAPAAAVPDADPSDAAADPAATRIASKPITSKQEVAASLAAVIGYFTQKEPSNPALLLIRQARHLVGKNFVEILRVLVPESFEDSRIAVGSEQRISFPMGRLSELMPATDEDTLAEAGDHDARVAAVSTRPQAIAELEQVAAFYRSTEPSSPIPLLIDRARSLVPLDFMSLLREIAPKREP